MKCQWVGHEVLSISQGCCAVRGINVCTVLFEDEGMLAHLCAPRALARGGGRILTRETVYGAGHLSAKRVTICGPECPGFTAIE